MAEDKTVIASAMVHGLTVELISTPTTLAARVVEPEQRQANAAGLREHEVAFSDRDAAALCDALIDRLGYERVTYGAG